jgi:hypothetical protein
MSKYDYNYEDEKPQKAAFELETWDYLSIGVLVISLCMIFYFAAIFVAPNSPINPFPPNPFDPNATITPTITPIQPDATWTPSPTIEPSPSSTLAATFTPLPSPTFFSLIPPTNTETPSPTATVTRTPKAPFSATVNVLQSDITIPHLAAQGCNWQGIGGSVVDANNSDIIGMVVRLVGKYNGKSVEMTSVSGVTPDYGKSGFEFVLGTTPLAAKDELFVQLLDQAGLPLSDNVYIETFNDCKKNLVLVRFKKNR